MDLRNPDLETTVRPPAQSPKSRVNARMKVKIQERMDELLRSAENRRLMSDALAKGSDVVKLKDDKDQEVTIHLQRKRETYAVR